MTESTGKRSLGPAPDHDRPVGELREYIARAYGLPPGYRIGEVYRHGGRDDSPLVVEVVPPGDGKPVLIRYDEERLCRDAGTLRGQAARDTDGLTRGDLIVGKAAQALYEALCSLAAVYAREDPCDLTHEWLQSLYASAEFVPGHTLDRDGRYAALAALQSASYTRGRILAAQFAQAHHKDDVEPPKPPLLLIERDPLAGVHITSRHLGLFVRLEMGAERISDSKAAGRVVELGGERHALQAWNLDRTDKKRLVLIRLPEDAEDGDEDGEVADAP